MIKEPLFCIQIQHEHMMKGSNTPYNKKLSGLLAMLLLQLNIGLACAELPALLTEAASAAAGRQYTLVMQLKTYSHRCWDMRMRQMLSDILAARPAHWREWALLAGSLQMEQPLREQLMHCAPGDNRAEALRIALVRCGDQHLLRQMMQEIGEKPLNDEFVYQYAPLLVYIRQDTAIRYLLRLINTYDRNCSGALMEASNQQTCAYRLMELVAPVIVDFPIPWDPLLEELDTPDYEQALAEVRQWIRKQGNTCKLRTDIY